MIAARQLRLLAVAALEAIPNLKVTSPGSWPSTAAQTPEAKCRALGEVKEPRAKSITAFDTTVSLEVELRLQAPSAQEAQDSIEDLIELAQGAILCSRGLVALTQQFRGVKTEINIDSEGQQHIGAARITFAIEVAETFDPVVAAPGEYPAMQQARLHLDAIAPFDRVGTYENAAFPASVTPAPRQAGPDGRDEGALLIDLPQGTP